MARVFVYDNRELPDPDPELSPEEVKRIYTDFFPEVANSEVRQSTRNGDTLYEFQRRVGTKGHGHRGCR